MRDRDLDGGVKLANFESAPELVQRQFREAMRARVEWEHELAAERAELEDPEAAPSIALRRRKPPRVIWDEHWEARARRQRNRETAPLEWHYDLEPEIAALHEIEAIEYVEKLSGEWVPPASRKIICPLPDHEEQTPSFHVYAHRWHCFGCGADGDIYDLAAALWGLTTSGADFRRLHGRLWEMFR